MTDDHIYKIFQTEEWAHFVKNGAFEGSADDKRDGFIHLSTKTQLQGTLDKHYSDVDDVVIAQICASSLGDALKYEVSRGGALFPHLYGVLESEAMTRHWILSATTPLSADIKRRYAVSEILSDEN